LTVADITGGLVTVTIPDEVIDSTDQNLNPDGNAANYSNNVWVQIMDGAGNISDDSPAQTFTLAPIVVDLDGDGVEYSHLDESNVMFDADGDGEKEHVAWAGADDGLLVFDFNKDNNITLTNEVSFIGYKEGAQTDLEGLRGLDTSNDNVLSQEDDTWSMFKIWNDADLDGTVDDGELKTLDELGISEFILESDDNMNLIGDIIEHGKSSYTKTDGTQLEFSDAEFYYEDNDFEVANIEEYTTPVNYDSSSVTESDIVEFYQDGIGQEYYSQDELSDANGTIDSFIANSSNEIDTIVINYENSSF
jgi:hypothetical protein